MQAWRRLEGMYVVPCNLFLDKILCGTPVVMSCYFALTGKHLVLLAMLNSDTTVCHSEYVMGNFRASLGLR